MRSFKQYLKEEQDNFEFWPEEDVMEWATENGHRVLKKYNLRGSSAYFVKEPVMKLEAKVLNAEQVNLTDASEWLPRIGNSDLRHFPYQFGHIARHFFAANCDLGSLKGAPKIVEGKFSISSNPNITSIEHLPSQAATYILRGTNIKSFSGIHKIIKKINIYSAAINGEVIIPASAEHALLGFLKIPGCTNIDIGFSERNIAPAELINACEIITKHLQGDKNIMDCQEELMDNNLEQFAQL